MISQPTLTHSVRVRPTWEQIEYGLLATLSALGVAAAFLIGATSFLAS